MVKSIRLHIVIEKDSGIERHNFTITKFLFRKLHVVYKAKFYLRTKTELLKWINNIFCEVN